MGHPAALTPLYRPSTLVCYLKTVWAWRHLGLGLVSRAVKGSMRRSLFGRLWSVLNPVIPMTAFIAIRIIVGADDTNVHPVAYVAVGMLVWHFMTDPMLQGTRWIQRNSALVTSSAVPCLIVIFAGFLRTLLDGLYRLIIVVPALIVFGEITWSVLWALFLTVPMAMLALTISIFVAVAGTASDDAERLVQIALRYLVFVSLAIFPIGSDGPFAWLMLLNPIAIFIDSTRSLILLGTVEHGIALAAYTLLSVLSFSAAVAVIARVDSAMKGNLH